MLNYIWGGLIVFSLVFALWTDFGDLAGDRFANGRPLPVTIELPPDLKPDEPLIPVHVRIDPEQFTKHYGLDPDQSVDLPESYDARLEIGKKHFGLSLAEGAALPEPLATVAKQTDADDVLRGQLQPFKLAPGEIVHADLELRTVWFIKVEAITAGAFNRAKWAVMDLALPLIGGLCLWLGVVKIGEAAGLVDQFVRMIRPLLGFLFPEIPKAHPALGMIALNLGANVLGLGNAATPLGIKAMQELQKLNPVKDTATNSMCTFLAINTASVQLVPPATLVAVIGVSSGQLFVPILIVTGLSLVIAIIAVRLLQKLPIFMRTDPMTQAPAPTTSEEGGND